jgi:hypothetical protein
MFSRYAGTAWRGMLLKNNTGDLGILVGAWNGSGMAIKSKIMLIN